MNSPFSSAPLSIETEKERKKKKKKGHVVYQTPSIRQEWVIKKSTHSADMLWFGFGFVWVFASVGRSGERIS